MAAFPGALPTFTGFTSTHTLAADNHAAQHNLEQAEIVQVATKLGTGASTPVSGSVLKGNGVGTSAWSPIDLTTDTTGSLPVNKGGTGQDNLNNLTFGTPTIADLTNMQHDHTSASDGGTLGADSVNTTQLVDDSVTETKVVGIAKDNLTTDSNPYKFSAYRSSALTPGTADIIFNTELFDTNSNFDTSNGRYTAPVDGFYQLNAGIVFNTAAGNIGYSTYIKKNGAAVARSIGVMMYAGAYSHGYQVSTLVQATAGDYFTVSDAANCNRPIVTGAESTFFNGFLVCTT